MSVLGIDKTPPWNKCDKDLVEKHKLDSLLHKAVANGKATGTTTDKRTDVWSRASSIYTQIFSSENSWFSPHKRYFPKYF
jgi:hypothetical protein